MAGFTVLGQKLSRQCAHTTLAPIALDRIANFLSRGKADIYPISSLRVTIGFWRSHLNDNASNGLITRTPVMQKLGTPFQRPDFSILRLHWLCV